MNEVIESIETHIENAYEGIAAVGGNIPEHKNLENISASINNLYDKLPKVTATGEDILLTPTRQGEMKIDLKGNTSQTTIAAETGTNTEDINISISSVNTNKEHVIGLNGNTYQETTTGKNLWGGFNYSKEISGLTCTYNIDGTITINGTARDNATTTTVANAIANNIYVELKPGTYTASCDNLISGVSIEVYDTNSNGKTNTFTLTETTNIIVRLRVVSGTIINNINFKLQLESGSTATDYEPYTNGASPNPNYPQNIETTTGENNIVICGKNLFNKNNITQGYIKQDGTTNTGNAEWAISDYINVVDGNNYTYQGLTDIGNAPYSAYYDKNKNFISSFKQQIGTNTITIPNNAYYVRFTIRVSVSDENTFMLEKGSTASTYENYTSQIYSINLGKNLFNKNNANLITVMKNANDNYFVNIAGIKSTYIKIKPNTTYTVSKIKSARFALYLSTSIPDTNVVINNYINNSTETSLTITSGENDNYLTVYFWHNSDTLTEQEILDTIQIEQGAIATTYASYFEPIELCRLGIYKDKIYKQNDKWYLEKNIEKVILNGTEEWYNTYGTNLFNVAALLNNKPFIVGYGLSNYYKYNSIQSGINAGTNNGDIALQYSGGYNVLIKNTSYSTPSDFKAWLTTHNTIIYYPLKNSTTTEITNNELINQLNNLYNSTLYTTTNISTETNNLLPYIDLTYNKVTSAPSPDKSSNIEISTGENNITICGKNLFNINAQYYKRRDVDNVSINGDNIIVQNEEISAHQFVWWNIPIGIGKQITISYDSLTETNSNTNNAVYYLFNNELYTTFTDFSDGTKIDKTNKYATTTSTGKYLVIGLRTMSSATNTLSKLQVEVSSTASTYEAYQRTAHQINLGKNLFDKDNANILMANINTNAKKIYYLERGRTLYIPCQPNTTYTVSKIQSTRFVVASSINYEYNSDITVAIQDNEGTSITITTGPKDKYLCVFYYFSTSDTLTEQEIRNTIQIEKGSTATSYSPYFTPIELCKIGTYQDYFYKDNGNWYKHSEIGKYVYNNDLTSNGITENYVSLLTPVLNIGASITSLENKAFCNMLPLTIVNNTGLNGTSSSNKIRVQFSSCYATSYDEAKSICANNNLTIYYQLDTPTNTQITNTTLINQLDNLQKAISYDGQTNINQNSTNKPFILNASALKKKAS